MRSDGGAFVATLNGRIGKLEAAAVAALGPDHCRGCGLRHVTPVTIAVIRAVLRVEGVRPSGDVAPRLCLCGCCADGRYLARLSHGLPTDLDAA
jgi:hypothetical protein